MTDSFLSRWARVKAEAKAPTIETAVAAPLPDAVPAQPGNGENIPELPDIETLTKDSNFSAFLQSGVPDHLRKAALSRLWASDPLFSQAEVYDLHMEDYSQPAIPEIVKTAWKLGKGMVDELGEFAPIPVDFTDDTKNTHKDTAKDKLTLGDA